MLAALADGAGDYRSGVPLMAHASALVPALRADGAWLHCPDCDGAFWGAHRPTDFVQVKLDAHRVKAHGAAGRPQRRNAQPKAQVGAPDAGLLACITAFVAAHVGGAKRLGAGVSREVFDFGPDHVIKIASDPQAGHNAAEAKAWANAPAWAKPFLAPVLAVDPKGKWLLMSRATRIGEASNAQQDAVAAGLHYKIGDLHRHNVGWLDGRWVAIDYAGGWQAVNPW